MKLLIVFTIFLSLHSSLNAYSKKIIFTSFKDEKSAEKSFSHFKNKGKNYKYLISLAEEKNFKVYIRKSGKYYIIVAEPFVDKKVLKTAMNIVKYNFKNAYANNYTPPKNAQIEIKKEQKVEQKLKILVVKEQNSTKPLKKEFINKELNITTERRIIQKSVDVRKIEENITKKEEKKILKKRVLKNENKQRVAKESDTDIWTMIKYTIFLLIFVTLTYYFRKFKKIYDEY